MTVGTSPIHAALERAVELGEIGAGVAVYVGDECIADERIGSVAPGGEPVEPDTLFPVFSVTKAMIATSVHLRAERGLLDYDAPVAEYWPEFAQQGKGDITVRHVLCHHSGMAAMPPDITPARVADWDWVTGELAAMAPLHPPGAVNAYHALSFWVLDPDESVEPSPNALPESIFAGGRSVLYQTGAGGSLGWADRDARVAVGICHNRMFGPVPAPLHPWSLLGDAIAEELASHATR